MINKRIFLNIIIVIALCILVFVMLRYRLLFPCETNILYDCILYFSIILFPILLYYLFKINNVAGSKDFWTGIIFLFIIGYSIITSTDIALNDIRKNGGVIKVAVIYDKYVSVRNPYEIYYTYNIGEKKSEGSNICSKYEYERLDIGDTILIIHSLRCPSWDLLYNYFPTKDEIKKCKDGCLVKGDKLVIH